QLGQADQARAAWQEAAAMLKATGQEAHPRASLVYLGLAVVEMMSGRGPASERWITRAIELETRTFGGAHPSTAAMGVRPAQMFSARGPPTRAAELAQGAASALVPRTRSKADLLTEALAVGFLSLRHLKRHDAVLRWLEPLLESLRRIDPEPQGAIAY